MVETSHDIGGRSNLAYQRNANTAWRTIAGETIVVQLFSKEFFGLNETGADVWNALDGSVSLGDLADRLRIAPKDLAAFCAELAELELIEVVGDGALAPETAPAMAAPTSSGPQTDAAEPPRIVWREEIRQVAASCAFHPATNPVCNQAPFS